MSELSITKTINLIKTLCFLKSTGTGETGPASRGGEGGGGGGGGGGWIKGYK